MGGHRPEEGAESAADIRGMSAQELGPLRDAVWRDLGWIDSFIAAHRGGLADEALDIVASWKRAIVGEKFLILKQLKRHAIFLLDGKAYGVLALANSFEDMLGPYGFPAMVDAVLLPFGNRITYDGVLKTYQVTFGGGIRKHLEDDYRQAKKRGAFFTSLDPQTATSAPIRSKPRSKSAWRELTSDIASRSEKLRGGAPLTSSAFSLLRASAKLAQAATREPNDLYELDRLETSARRALTRFRNLLVEEEHS